VSGFRRLFRLSGREPPPAEDIAAEFEAHLQMKADALVRAGRSPEEAWREAEARFGPLSRYALECRRIPFRQRGADAVDGQVRARRDVCEQRRQQQCAHDDPGFHRHVLHRRIQAATICRSG
jgi:hypothetical protein